MISTVAAQDIPASTVSTESDVPFLGWGVIGMMGAARRRRHQLNNYDYTTESEFLN